MGGGGGGYQARLQAKEDVEAVQQSHRAASDMQRMQGWPCIWAGRCESNRHALEAP